MSQPPLLKLDATSFLQLLVTQSVRLSRHERCRDGVPCENHIQLVGPSVSPALEKHARFQLNLPNEISHDQYAQLIVSIKNQIGGCFSYKDSGDGYVRVSNSRCPFGERVKESPELCQMTSSIFGSIAARNFGYAKVQLRHRIATGDSGCEVIIYLDREAAREHEGDEYIREGASIVSRPAYAEFTELVAEKISRSCNNAHSRNGCSRAAPEIVADSLAMRTALRTAEVVAPTMASVLITGKPGLEKRSSRGPSMP